MSFTSFAFAAFLVAVALLTRLAPPRLRWVVMLLASLAFYASWSWRFLPVPLGCWAVVWWGGRHLARLAPGPGRRAALFAYVFVALLPLLTCKYLVELWQGFAESPALFLALPLGISYFTFQAVGYLVSVYQGRIPAPAAAGPLGTHLLFFPQLLAGPIERAERILLQLAQPPPLDYARTKRAILLIFAGLFKKVVIADSLYPVVALVFENYRAYSGLSLITAAILARFFIFYDFSGYSDMARGAASLLGVEIMNNFRRPFFSRSITEFWQRWHISLSEWMRENVFIPLVLTRFSRLGIYPLIIFTFFLLGLWHGATANFAIYGILQGVMISLQDSTRRWRAAAQRALGIHDDSWPLRVAQILTTFLIFVCLPTVLFYSTSLAQAGYIYGNLFHGFTTDFARWSDLGFLREPLGNRIFSIFGLMLLMEGVHALQEQRPIYPWFNSLPRPVRWLAYLTAISLFLLLGRFAPGGRFIYQNF